MTSAIKLVNARFAYPKNTFAVFCDKLCFKSGKITLVTGKNGSGKTTLLKLCCGILRPQVGVLYVFGEDANKWPLGRIGRSIGYLFQEPSHQLFTATVWDEMTFIGSIRGENSEETKEKAITLLGRFNLLDLRERSIYRLSRGEKQRLALAAILMQDIRFLILDEPTTGLDSENRNTLYSSIESFLDKGMGIAVISHNKEMISRYGENRIAIENGRVMS